MKHLLVTLLLLAFSTTLLADKFVEKQVTVTGNKTSSIKETLPSIVQVQISSNPEGAKFYVDEKYRGITPVTVYLSLNNHKFELQKKDYENTIVNGLITPVTKRLNFSLKLLPQTVTISSKPIGAKIFIDDNPEGTTLKDIPLTPGKHKIEVKAPGYISRKEIIIVKNHPVRKNFTLQPSGMVCLGYVTDGEIKGGEAVYSHRRIEWALASFAGNSNDNNITGGEILLGYRIYYPIGFSFHAGVGFRSVTDNNKNEKDYTSAVVGTTIPILLCRRFGFGLGLYIKPDYWFSTENDGQFIFSFGIVFGF